MSERYWCVEYQREQDNRQLLRETINAPRISIPPYNGNPVSDETWQRLVARRREYGLQATDDRASFSESAGRMAVNVLDRRARRGEFRR